MELINRLWRPKGRRILLPERHKGFFADVTHRNADGRVLWAGQHLPNVLHDAGERWILANSFDTNDSGAGVPASIYMGLRTNAATTEGDTLGSGLTEVSGTSYARQAISTTTGFTLSQSGGDWRATSGSVVFTAGGTWTGAVALFLATTSDGTGILISSVALSTTRTLQNGDTLTCTTYIALSE